MSETWTVTYEDEIDGKPLHPGVSFGLFGERGKRYNYIRTVTNDNGDSWIDCFGGTKQNQKSRSIHHELINPELVDAARLRPPTIKKATKAKARKGKR